MDNDKTWILTISMVAVISGIIESLLPDRKYKKLFRFATCIVLLYVFLQPIMGNNSINFHIEDYLHDNYEVSENIDKLAQDAMVGSAEKAIEDMFIDFADKNNIEFNVQCKCTINDNEIKIDNIYIFNCTPKESEDMVINFAVNSGFNNNQLNFQGETDEN